MAISAIVGLPGMGKTLFGVHMLRRVKGRRRYANLFPRSGEWEFALWDEMCDVGHAVVLVDEAHMWFGSRNWQETKQHELAAWQQHRKQGLDLWLTVQNLKRLDPAVRELLAYVHLVKRFGNWILDTQYYAEDVTDNKRGKPYKRRLVYIDPHDYASYWTEQIIGMKDGQGMDLGRLARRPEEPPLYERGQGRLRGPELRYMIPTTVVLRCQETVVRLPWNGSAAPIAETLRAWVRLGFNVSTVYYAVAFEFDGPTGLVKWSFADYLRSGSPIPAAILSAVDGRAADDVESLAASRWTAAGGRIEAVTEVARPRGRQRRNTPALS